MAKILIIDDNAQIRRAVEKFLTKAGHSAVVCVNGSEGLAALSESEFDLVLSDLKMPIINGIEFLAEKNSRGIDTPVILLTGHGSVDSAVEAMKMGASDYLSKPIQLPELSHRIERLLESKELRAENKRLKSELKSDNSFEEIVGKSPSMLRVFDTLKQLAGDRNISVLISGETGTGKELVARALHYNGPRAESPFVAINCAALPDNLLESELFGYEKGAFTDARNDKKGLFEAADGGTLFLDEIDSMTTSVQVKLLRAIEARVIRRVGGTEDIPLDLRLVTAANRNLEEAVKSGEFRSDLYFRIAVAPVHMPPLRERSGDIILLVKHFCRSLADDKKRNLTFTAEAVEILDSYDWPGNVRELQNLIERLIVTNHSAKVGASDLPQRFRQNFSKAGKLEEPSSQNLKAATRHVVEDFEIDFILSKLNSNRWNITRTAKEIGLSRASLHAKIKQYSLRKT